LISLLLSALAVCLGIPVAILFAEVAAACTFSPRQSARQAGSRPRIGVLVPAHNESNGLIPTVEDLKSQLREGDRLLVIADNCTDDTADVAKAAGAEVLIRTNLEQIGKGYALDWGVRHLAADPPAIVMIVDADCRLARGAVDELAAACVASQRPAQALYLIAAPEQSPINYQVSEFAFLVKNKVRPLGLAAFNLPCQLMGTGMAFPWDVIRSARLASGSIVEDLKLGLELAEAGSPALFCPSAVVTSRFPWSAEGTKSQSKRWEGGHLSMIRTTAPRFLLSALRHANASLLLLTLDMLVPPLSLLVLLLLGMFGISAAAIAFGASASAFVISTLNILALALAIFLSWSVFGHEVLPSTAIFSVVKHVVTKLSLYAELMWRGGASQWTRTDRKKDQ